ncbi:MAG: hypothetical protein GTO41_28395 [Burkholderiales bacterium]|nr:hypothetical protein [Burkholderiales bacterium]
MQRESMGAVISRCVLIAVPIFLVFNAEAACQSELRILADDLASVKLTSAQSQLIADKVLQARRHCWVQREEAAMELINSARRMAGLKESSGKFDWETVPLETLEGPQSGYQ